MSNVDRRGFLTGAGLAGLALAPQTAAQPRTEKQKLDRIASNTWPIRYIFKSRTGFGRNPRIAEMKQKYGEITMLDFPQFTRDHFPGVTHMDLFSGLVGDVADDSMYVKVPVVVGAQTRVTQEFDPSSPSGRRWLEKLAAQMAATGTRCQHISNNAPRDICEPDAGKRRAGIEVAKKWLDGARILGAKSMRVNSGGPRILPDPEMSADGYPKADAVAAYLRNCIESFKEMADYGGKAGVKVTLENHWGLTANPMNIRIIVDEVKSPWCEASPDFCNWEHEYLMYNGLKALAPYAHTNVHAKYWNRWKDDQSVARSVRIMQEAGFEGTYALEYEDGPWDGVEGAKYLYREVLAAL
ncbi:MAG TPA: TIM barrel protein [Bryobacteraceae bacterium]|jgi:sugar phosphate isomerase/epimerase|nr:TIM barrel protein [Bryobacteraceae bacterium]